MTSDQQNQFEAEWPALALRLEAMLKRKRLSDWLVEDLVQETGCRLIRMWSQVDRAKPVWPLVATIALNLLRDEMRKGSWNELTGAVPDAPSVENTEARGLARLELRQLGGALSQMKASQRSVLLAEVTEGPADGADPSAMRMLRMRARRRLHQLMDQASVLGVTVGCQLRRVMREAEVVISKALPLDAERVPAAVLSVAAALSIGLAALPGDLVDGPWPIGGGGGASSEAPSEAVVAAIDGEDATGLSARDDDRVRRATDTTSAGRSSGGRGRGSDDDTGPTDEGGVGSGTNYHIPVAQGTYVSGSTEVELEGFDEESRDLPHETVTGTGSISCSTSPSGGAGASCTHGGEGWSQRSARVKQRTEVWVQGERVY